MSSDIHPSDFLFLVLLVYFYQPITLHPHAHMLSHVTPWTAAHQAPLSMDFSRQEYWSGLPFPSPPGLLFEARSSPLVADIAPELSHQSVHCQRTSTGDKFASWPKLIIANIKLAQSQCSQAIRSRTYCVRRKALNSTSVESPLQTLIEDKGGEPSVPTVHVPSYPISLEVSREPSSALVPSGHSQGRDPQVEDTTSE